MKVLSYVLGVLSIILFVVVVIGVVLVSGAANTQQPKQAWQLGVCVDDEYKRTTCRMVGAPMPINEEGLCKALRDSMQQRINRGRVHCTKVLVDAEFDA